MKRGSGGSAHALSASALAFAGLLTSQ
jgi:hypothetical protein